MDGFRQFKAAKPPQQHQQQPKLKFGMSAILGCNDRTISSKSAHRQFTGSQVGFVAPWQTAQHHQRRLQISGAFISSIVQALLLLHPHCILSLLLDLIDYRLLEASSVAAQGSSSSSSRQQQQQQQQQQTTCRNSASLPHQPSAAGPTVFGCIGGSGRGRRSSSSQLTLPSQHQPADAWQPPATRPLPTWTAAAAAAFASVAAFARQRRAVFSDCQRRGEKVFQSAKVHQQTGQKATGRLKLGLKDS
uniref:Uncharacterized protein n=1 Tax=Macrostomum lignano TaxID=282301 RepID=A0A1I8JN99_9PLAT